MKTLSVHCSGILRRAAKMCRVASFRQQVGGRTSLVPCRGVDKIRNRQNQLPHHLPESELLNTVLQLLAEQGYEGFAEGGRLLVNEAIREERASVLQAQPYGRTETRLGPANGYQAQTVAITFQVPQVRRKTAFYPSALEKGLRSERAFKLALAEMYGLGVFTRKVSAIVGKLYGFAVGSTQVSQCSAQSDAELRVWRERPLGAFACLIVDARCENFRHDGQLLDCAVLIAIGVGPDGKRQIISVNVALSDGEAHWRNFQQSPQARSLRGVEFIVSADHAGLRNACPDVSPPCPSASASSISSKTPRPTSPNWTSAPRSPRPFAASLTPRTIRPPTCVAWKSSSPAGIWPQTWQHGWKPTFPQAYPSLPDPSPSTGACAPASPASFPKKPHSSHWFQPD